jgi:RHS repeat-associated protein
MYESNNLYGFNGKEKDSEWNGGGGIYDYGFRIYDPRLGRFLSVDPLTKSYPELTPYQFASNTPIAAIDLDGLEAVIVVKSQWYAKKIIKALDAGDVKEAQRLALKAVTDPSKDDWQRNAFGKTAASFDVPNENPNIEVILTKGKRPIRTFTIESTAEANKQLKESLKEYFNLSSEDQQHRDPSWLEEKLKKLNQETVRKTADPLEEGNDPTTSQTTEGTPESETDKGYGDGNTYKETGDSGVIYQLEYNKEKKHSEYVPYIGPELTPGGGISPKGSRRANKDDSIKYDIK